MKFSLALVAAFVGAASAQSASASAPMQRPSVAPVLNSLNSHGCYNMSSKSWKKYQVAELSVGTCGNYCTDEIKSLVMALNGEDCYCGSEYPPKKALVADSNCNFPCPQYKPEACGGIDPILFYSVYNTGKKLIVPDEELATTSVATTAKPTSTAPAVETIIETPTSEPSATQTGESKKGGTNVAGIAAGVVVGVVAIAAIVGGAFFFVRRKRNKEIEEEHRRNAAVSAFIGGKPPSSSGNSMADSRMDPTLAHRRMSDGSIADNQDYSRKILRVTNA